MPPALPRLPALMESAIALSIIEIGPPLGCCFRRRIPSDCSEDCDGGAVVESPSGECASFSVFKINVCYSNVGNQAIIMIILWSILVFVDNCVVSEL